MIFLTVFSPWLSIQVFGCRDAFLEYFLALPAIPAQKVFAIVVRADVVACPHVTRARYYVAVVGQMAVALQIMGFE
jgi:hypothetical protein